MEHKVTEQFICLSLNPDSGRYLVLGNYLSYGVVGAMMMDLSLGDKLKIEGNRVYHGSDTSLTGIPGYDRMIKKISGAGKERTIKKWIQGLGFKSAWYRKEMQKFFVKKGILKVENKRFIGIPYKLHYIARPGFLINLVKRYKDIILFNKQPEDHEVMVLGLIYACKMHKVLAKGGPERRKIRKRIVEMIKDNTFAKEINKSIMEIQAAITASIAASAAASASASASASSG